MLAHRLLVVKHKLHACHPSGASSLTRERLLFLRDSLAVVSQIFEEIEALVSLSSQELLPEWFFLTSKHPAAVLLPEGLKYRFRRDFTDVWSLVLSKRTVAVDINTKSISGAAPAAGPGQENQNEISTSESAAPSLSTFSTAHAKSQAAGEARETPLKNASPPYKNDTISSWLRDSTGKSHALGITGAPKEPLNCGGPMSLTQTASRGPGGVTHLATWSNQSCNVTPNPTSSNVTNAPLASVKSLMAAYTSQYEGQQDVLERSISDIKRENERRVQALRTLSKRTGGTRVGAITGSVRADRVRIRVADGKLEAINT